MNSPVRPGRAAGPLRRYGGGHRRRPRRRAAASRGRLAGHRRVRRVACGPAPPRPRPRHAGPRRCGACRRCPGGAAVPGGAHLAPRLRLPDQRERPDRRVGAGSSGASRAGRTGPTCCSPRPPAGTIRSASAAGSAATPRWPRSPPRQPAAASAAWCTRTSAGCHCGPWTPGCNRRSANGAPSAEPTSLRISPGQTTQRVALAIRRRDRTMRLSA